MNDLAAGAMPGSGASPDHAYSFGPSWAMYHLPFPGARAALTARDAGVGFEGEGDGGSGDPPAGDGNPDPMKTTGDPPPATGDKDPEGLNDAGKRALEAERQARRDADARAKSEKAAREAAEKERDELKAATQSDQDKALEEARKEARKATAAEYESKIRRAEARSALRAAGMTNEKALDLYANAPEFSSLKVADDGSVEGLAGVIEDLKKAVPESFAPARPAPGGAPSRGPQGDGSGDRPKTLSEAIAARYAPTGG